MARRLEFSGLAILASLLMGFAPADSGRDAILFENAIMKGALTMMENSSIPKDYHGQWADHSGNCYTSADRGRQVSITRDAIGLHPLISVAGYSDHPAIVVTVATGEGGQERVSLDLSLDGKYLSFQDDRQYEAEIFVRCPAHSDAPEQALPTLMDEAADR